MPDDDPTPAASNVSPDAPDAGPDASASVPSGATAATPAETAGSNAAPGSPRAGVGRSAAEPGSPARFGRRLAALVVDCVLSALVAALFTRPEAPRLWSALVFFVEYTLFLGVFGQTPGMRVFRIGCIRVDGAPTIGIPRAAVRAVLLQLFFPAVLLDRAGRGWHDRAAGTLMINV